jgi:hypothetical protein
MIAIIMTASVGIETTRPRARATAGP